VNAALPPPQAAAPWAVAASAAALFAVDPPGTGVVVRSAAGAARDAWLELVREALPGDRAWRRVPLHVADHRLLGGLDLTATLRAGRPVAERGLLVEADGTLLVLAMAERVEPSMAARIGAVLDARAVVLERDGITLVTETSFGVIALDEGAAPEERVSPALRDRLAFEVDLRALRPVDCPEALFDRESIAAARERLPRVVADDATLTALCRAGLALGVDSLRASCQALRVACAAAALGGRDRVSEDDAALAAALVFGHRATRVPPASADESAGDEQEAASAEERPAPDPSPEPPPEALREPPAEARGEESAADGAIPPAPPNSAQPTEPEPSPTAAALDEEVVAAATAAIPADLLARLANAGELRGAAGAGGRSGGWRASKRRGRPAGVRRGELRAGSRLNVIETLRAAAPWQPLRRRAGAAPSPSSSVRPRIEIRQDDFRVTRYRERTQTTTIFAVDASGSAALHRLGEAKGAVELLLADCYVRRDQVALIAFRGRGADLMLPPTRSLLRAKRGLAALPGGGGTPLASGLDAALLLADATRRRGEVALIVLLTDGRGNIARDGRPGRDAAEADALAAARSLRLAGHAALLVDTSPQPRPQAARLAREMNARYLALPYADATRISGAILGLRPRPP
jgi:magnesium chelatase subunit D